MRRSDGGRDGALGCVAFHNMHGVGTQDRTLSRLNGWPMRSLLTTSPTSHNESGAAQKAEVGKRSPRAHAVRVAWRSTVLDCRLASTCRTAACIQSIVAPLARMGALHRSIAAAHGLTENSGPRRSGAVTSSPTAAKRSRTDRVSSVSPIARLRRCTIAAGVSLGKEDRLPGAHIERQTLLDGGRHLRQRRPALHAFWATPDSTASLSHFDPPATSLARDFRFAADPFRRARNPVLMACSRA
jgi:hypothetical protein